MSLVGENLSCIRGDHLVFEGLDFALEAGQALWATGPNGSGKSTLLRLVAGLLKAEAGHLSWQGQNLNDDSDGFINQFHYVGHLDGLKPAFTVRENLQFWADFGGGGNVDTALEGLDLEKLADLSASILSAGQKRRCNLARLLLQDRPLWILDEPINALDSHYLAFFTACMESHLEKDGMILFASHHELGLKSVEVFEIEKVLTE
jgi:heme exporter protein A